MQTDTIHQPDVPICQSSDQYVDVDPLRGSGVAEAVYLDLNVCPSNQLPVDGPHAKITRRSMLCTQYRERSK